MKRENVDVKRTNTQTRISIVVISYILRVIPVCIAALSVSSTFCLLPYLFFFSYS